MRDRKLGISVIAALVAITIGLFGCGSDTSGEGEKQKLITHGAAPVESEMRTDEFDNVVLVDDDFVKITLVKFYQQETNYAMSEGLVPKTTNNMAFEIENKSDEEINIQPEAYLDGEKLYSPIGGDNFVKGGKKGKFSITLGKDGTPDWTDLDSFDDMYDVELYLTVQEYYVGGKEVEYHADRIGDYLGK